MLGKIQAGVPSLQSLQEAVESCAIALRSRNLGAYAREAQVLFDTNGIKQSLTRALQRLELLCRQDPAGARAGGTLQGHLAEVLLLQGRTEESLAILTPLLSEHHVSDRSTLRLRLLVILARLAQDQPEEVPRELEAIHSLVSSRVGNLEPGPGIDGLAWVIDTHLNLAPHRDWLQGLIQVLLINDRHEVLRLLKEHRLRYSP